MKTGKTIPAFSLDNPGVYVPTSWQEVGEGHYAALMELLSLHDAPTAKLLAFLLLAGIKVLADHGADRKVVSVEGVVCSVDKRTLAMGAEEVSFILTPPDYPRRFDEWEGAKARDAEFHGVPFGIWLQAEGIWQQHLAELEAAPEDVASPTVDSDYSETLARLLYPGLPEGFKSSPTFHTMMFCWMCGLKQYFAALFPHLFRKKGSAAEIVAELRDITFSQLRALTGGDITKEEDVLNADTWSALSELNAKAREAEEMDREK